MPGGVMEDQGREARSGVRLLTLLVHAVCIVGAAAGAGIALAWGTGCADC